MPTGKASHPESFSRRIFFTRARSAPNLCANQGQIIGPTKANEEAGTAKRVKATEIEGLTLDEMIERYTARFRDREPDWEAFADSKTAGYRRAQHRFIGAGGSGKHGDANVIPPGAFTLSVMYVPPGQGNASHTHEVEEVFFVLKGYLTAFLEDETGRRISVRLGPWECISCPAGVIHGYKNESLEPVYFQTMLGKGRPDLIGYTDPELFRKRGAHLAKYNKGSRRLNRSSAKRRQRIK